MTRIIRDVNPENKIQRFSAWVVAVLVLALGVVSALKGYPPWIIALTLSVAVVALSLEHGQAFIRNIHRKWAFWRNGRILLAASESFRDHVISFEAFVRTDSGDLSLCSILQSHLREKFGEVFDNAPPLNSSILHSVWVMVSAHAKLSRDPEDIELSIEDFAMLLDLHSIYHLMPIYETCSDSLHRAASRDLISKLNAAREKYVLFRAKYGDWLADLNRQLKVKNIRFPSRDVPLPL